MALYNRASDVAHYIRRRGKKSMYIPKRVADLSALNVGNAGPRPNVTGMRNKYWGKDAIIGLQGGYAYLLADR